LSGADATTETLARVINSLKFNEKRTKLLSENMSGLMPHDAAEKIAKLIIKQHEQ